MHAGRGGARWRSVAPAPIGHRKVVVARVRLVCAVATYVAPTDRFGGAPRHPAACRSGFSRDPEFARARWPPVAAEAAPTRPCCGESGVRVPLATGQRRAEGGFGG